MNLPSAVSRPAAYDVSLSILVAIAAVSLSKIARRYLPTPHDDMWVWLPAIAGLAAAMLFARSRSLPTYQFLLLFGLIGLSVQLLIQGIVALGFLR